MDISAAETVMAPIVEYLNPSDLILSSSSAVFTAKPCFLMHALVIFCSCFCRRERNFKIKCVFRVAAVDKAEILRNDFVENKAADRRVNELVLHDAVDFLIQTNLDG